MSVGPVNLTSVADRHNAIMAHRAAYNQAIRDMAVDMDVETARVVLTGPGKAIVYVKTRGGNGAIKLLDYQADVVDASGGNR